MRTIGSTAIAAFAAVLATGCASDPQYVPAPAGIEVGVDPMILSATATLTLPIKMETTEDAEARMAEETRLGVPLAYVQIGDLEVSIEWTIKSLMDRDAEARIKVNGGNQFFYYVPTNFVIDPEEDEEPPPLLGDIPIIVPAGGTRTGVFREDQLREASIDLEAITRGMVNPFAAVFNINEDDPEVLVEGVPVPIDALAQMIRVDLTFEAEGHMVLEYGLRVRAERDLLHRELLAAPTAELYPFMPAEFVPPPPPPE